MAVSVHLCACVNTLKCVACSPRLLLKPCVANKYSLNGGGKDATAVALALGCVTPLNAREEVGGSVSQSAANDRYNVILIDHIAKV